MPFPMCPFWAEAIVAEIRALSDSPYFVFEGPLAPATGAKAEEFIQGKHYDEKEKVAAKKLVKEVASNDLWDLLQGYFP